MPLSEDSEILSSFRGLEYSPVFSRKRGSGGVPISAEQLTRKFLQKISCAGEAADLNSKIAEKWEGCVGKKFVSKCAPINVRLNVLYVSACNSAVRQELIFLEKSILKNLHSIEGCSKIKKIKVL